MTRRVLAAIVGVAALAVVVFALPLALAARLVYRDQAGTRLERSAEVAAERTARQLSDREWSHLDLPAEDGVDLAVYDAVGTRVDGTAPAATDEYVDGALEGDIVDGTASGELLVAVPVADEGQVVGVVLASTSAGAADASTRRAWWAMGALGASIVAVAAGVGVAAARRVSRPVARLAVGAARLGDGDFDVDLPASGIPELDGVARALATTARRLGDTLNRERSFSANAAHQLRTPLTSMRIRLERTQIDPDADRDAAIAHALDQVDRLERTTLELLDLAREEPRPTGPLDVDRLLAEVAAAWRAPLNAAGRRLELHRDADLPATAVSAPAVRHALDALVDNGLRHGRGTVSVVVRDAGGAVAVDVRDEGLGPSGAPAAGTGLGLALARDLVERQGGRLTSDREGGSRFSLLLPVTSP